ncbi:TetR/AcrR family transcriptional regulator [Streptomyces sp. NPDC102360]|uniref:TetR/AcrR family transcriptional regulator n=1 Tax=Streptomyces sp. NPDC102360 TaxID=3366160 RepID=UPI0037F351F2
MNTNERASMAKRGPYKKSVQRRQEILDAVLSAYAEADAQGASLKAIAARVGLSEQALQHHFPSKNELLVEVLRDRDMQALDTAQADDTSLNLIDIMRRNEDQPGLVRLYSDMAAAAADPDHPAHDFFAERIERTTRGVSEFFARRRESPESSPEARPQARDEWAARIVLAAADGLQSRWLIDQDTKVAEDISRLVALLERFQEE